MIEYCGDIRCESCGWQARSVPNDLAWALVQHHVEDTGHQVSYDLVISRVDRRIAVDQMISDATQK